MSSPHGDIRKAITPGSTYAGQSSLPRLPIPTLEETLERFPAVVTAILKKEDMKKCLEEIRMFLETDGPVLQQLLIDYEQRGREEGRVGSFVEEFWTDAYLTPDSSVVMNLNPFFVLEDGPDTMKATSQSRRAASLCFSAIKFASSLKKEAIVSDSFRGKPLCMDQFRALFGACRVPEVDKDTVAVNPESTHVVVLENNQFYFFQALNPDGSVAVNEDDILEILTAIKSDASQVSPELSSRNALGVLTTLSRREWAVVRDSIVSHSTNNETSLDIVDGALFVLVIDNVAPNSISEAAANMLHGTYNLRSEEHSIEYQSGSCCNRWYDKLQIIVCQDGRAGINFEHSAIDGHTALRLVSDIFADNVISFAQSITKTIYSDSKLFPSVIQADVRRATDGNSALSVPRKLNFDLPQSVFDKIYFAETAMGDEIVASDTFVLEFDGFGKNMIVHNNLSPDSFVQLSIQLAYFRLYGKIVSQYEPVLMKSFYHGRTEAMRAATELASKFCKLWLNHAATKREKLEALRAATEHHSAGIKLSASGKGLERHLFSLMKIAEKNGIPTPDFFSSKAYTKLNHTVLSTSNCGNPCLRLFGFGPVVQDGFGIGYVIRDNGIQYSISSKHRQTKRYASTLKKTLIDMGNMLQPLSSVTVARNHVTTKENVSEAEYCDAYGDTFGESHTGAGDNSGSFGSNSSPMSSSAGRQTLARVLQRQPSIRASELSRYGQLLTSSDSAVGEEDQGK